LNLFFIPKLSERIIMAANQRIGFIGVDLVINTDVVNSNILEITTISISVISIIKFLSYS
jgi:hypothetical protein